MPGPSDQIVSPTNQPGTQASPQRAEQRANNPVDTDPQRDTNTAVRSSGSLPIRTSPAQGENALISIRGLGPPVYASLIPHRRVPPAPRDRLISGPGMTIVAKDSIGRHRYLDQPSHGTIDPANPFRSVTTGTMAGGLFAFSSWRPSSQFAATPTRSSPLPPLPSPTHATSEWRSRVPHLPFFPIQVEATPGASSSADLQLCSAAVASLSTLFETSSLSPASPTSPSPLPALHNPPSSTSPTSPTSSTIVAPSRVPLPASSPALPPPDCSRLRSDEIRPAPSAGRQQSSISGGSPILIHDHALQGQDGRWTATASPNPPMEIAAVSFTITRGVRTQLAVNFRASTDPARKSPATAGIAGGAGVEDDVEAEVEAEVKEAAARGQHAVANQNQAKEWSPDLPIAQRKVRGNGEPRSTKPTWTERRKQQVIEELHASQATCTGDHVRVGFADAAEGGSGCGAEAGAGTGAGVEGAGEVERGIFEFSGEGSHGVVNGANGNANRDGTNFNDQHMTVGSGSGSGRGEGLGEYVGGGGIDEVGLARGMK